MFVMRTAFRISTLVIVTSTRILQQWSSWQRTSSWQQVSTWLEVSSWQKCSWWQSNVMMTPRSSWHNCSWWQQMPWWRQHLDNGHDHNIDCCRGYKVSTTAYPPQPAAHFNKTNHSWVPERSCSDSPVFLFSCLLSCFIPWFSLNLLDCGSPFSRTTRGTQNRRHIISNGVLWADYILDDLVLQQLDFQTHYIDWESYWRMRSSLLPWHLMIGEAIMEQGRILLKLDMSSQMLMHGWSQKLNLRKSEFLYKPQNKMDWIAKARTGIWAP